MIEARIDRLTYNEKQTTGLFSVYDNFRQIVQVKSLELPWKENQSNISCIPVGKYKVVKRSSVKYGLHFHILDVEGRSYILIHSANFVRQLLGCVAVGENCTDIDGDGLKDVTNSKATMEKLLELLPNEFDLTIYNSFF